MIFHHDHRLGIELPIFEQPFESLPLAVQEDILVEWEAIRARIPDQILRFEHKITKLLDSIQNENDWDVVTQKFSQIADYATRIHELNTWRRVDQSLQPPNNAS